MQLELKIESTEEFLTLVEAIRGVPVAMAEEDLEEAITEMASERIDDLTKVNDLLRDQMAEIRHEMKVQRGALDETVHNVRTIERKLVEARPEPKNGNGKSSLVRGIYCRFCGKELDTSKSQKIFCSQGCAGRWQAQHKGQKATPRLTLKDEMLGTTVVPGEGVRE